MKTKALIALTLLLIISCVVGCQSCRPKTPESFSVAVVSIVEIEPIAELRKGFRDTFEKSQFYKDHKVSITEYNAQGDAGLINQISDKIAAEKPGLVYVLGTPLAQAIQKKAPDVLLVQGAVTDPVAAGLANGWGGSGKKYIATSDLPPVEKQLQLIRELTPKATKLGLIYNPGEANSVAVVSRLREQINKSGGVLQLVERPIANSSDVATAIQSLLGNVDAIYLPPDNTAHAALPVIGKFARENKIPFYATVSNALEVGALATLSLDFAELGRESAELALQVLGGKDPATVPIQISENPTVTINGKVAADFGLDLSAFRNKPNVKIAE
jgi:putative tryptophan/tyrosine transport system substrate-binding protein